VKLKCRAAASKARNPLSEGRRATMASIHELIS
jgi:hypothetical protein